MDMAYKLDAQKTILRFWAHDISCREFQVCMFIYDRTINWNQEWSRIPIDDFRDGKPPYRSHVQASRSTITAALSRLIEAGYILRRGRRGDRIGYSFSLNHDMLRSSMTEPPDASERAPGCTEKESEVVDLPKRRRDKKAPHDRSTACYMTDDRSSTQPEDGALITATENPNTKPQQSLRAEASLSEAEAGARAKTDEAVSRKAAKAGTAGALFMVWRSANLEAFPDSAVAPWPRYMVAQVKQFAALMSDPVTLLDFAVANWPKVIRDEFGWMTKNPPPRSPDIGFLMRHASGFTEAMNNHRNDNVEGWAGSADPRERLRRAGVPEAQIAKMRMPRGPAL